MKLLKVEGRDNLAKWKWFSVTKIKLLWRILYSLAPPPQTSTAYIHVHMYDLLATIYCFYKYLQWFFSHGLSRSGTEYGPLTDLPDWSYAGELYTETSSFKLHCLYSDGRAAPMPKRKKKRQRGQLKVTVSTLTSQQRVTTTFNPNIC